MKIHAVILYDLEVPGERHLAFDTKEARDKAILDHLVAQADTYRLENRRAFKQAIANGNWDKAEDMLLSHAGFDPDEGDVLFRPLDAELQVTTP
jgi:hypothetical protein